MNGHPKRFKKIVNIVSLAFGAICLICLVIGLCQSFQKNYDVSGAWYNFGTFSGALAAVLTLVGRKNDTDKS